MRGASGLLVRARKAVREHDVAARRLAVGKWLKDDVVAALRSRRAVPRAVKGDEGATTIRPRELRALVDLEVVGRPMRRERRDGRFSILARICLLAAVAAVLRRLRELALLPSK